MFTSVAAVMVVGFSLFLLSSSVLAFGYTDFENNEEIKIKESNTRPTFGSSHKNNDLIIDDGFKFNNQRFSIHNNYHTPFEEQLVHTGESNFFEATVYAEKGLKVQEFLFGIPFVGESHLAELRIEVWYTIDGEIKKPKLYKKQM